MADIFEDDGVTPTDNALEQLVGEGKKYKTVEDLAKAYANADSHIEVLKSDLQQTREFIASKLDELASKQQAPAPVQNVEPSANPTPAPVVPPNDSGEDLDARIAKALENKTLAERFQTNATLVQDVLVERLGSVEAATEAVIQKARELGVDGRYMKETAANSPKAFFSLMGIDPEQKPVSSSTPASRSDVNPHALQATQPKANTYEYYEQLRKSNPTLYWKPATQQALMKAASENPDFFSR